MKSTSATSPPNSQSQSPYHKQKIRNQKDITDATTIEFSWTSESAKKKMSTSIALPGQLLGPSSAYRPGPGVHLHDSQLYSSLLGAVAISQPPASASSNSKGPAKRMTKITANLHSGASATNNNNNNQSDLPTISVSRHAREVLPQVGNVVLCRVTRITPRQAVVAILVCGETVLEAEWQGVIRVQDVRATEKDRCKIYESFRPGDIVRASVVSGLYFFCSTSRGWAGLFWGLCLGESIRASH